MKTKRLNEKKRKKIEWVNKKDPEGYDTTYLDDLCL